MLQSARFQVNYPDPNRSDSADVPRDFGSVVVGLEQAAMYGQGTLASRPPSTGGSPGKQGRFYMATDQTPHILYYDFGTGWDAVGSLAAGSIGTTQLADGSVITIKLADGSVTAVKIAAGTITATQIADNTITAAKFINALKPSTGASAATEALRALGTAAGTAAAGTHALQHGPAGADPMVPSMGTVLPTVGLYNGYPFLLSIPNPGNGGSVLVDLVYRADLDGTYPWHSRGGASVYATGGLGGVWNGFQAMSGGYSVARTGYWETFATGGGGGPSQGAASVQLWYNNSSVGQGAANFSSGNNTGFACAMQGLILIGQVITAAGNNSNAATYSYGWQGLIRPLKII